jgi:hypothetical protein
MKPGIVGAVRPGDVDPGLIPGVDVPAPARNRLRKKAALSESENAAIRKGYGGGAAA